MNMQSTRPHNVKLKAVKDQAGNPVRGLWDSDVVRLEAVSGGWECSVPVRRIGKSNYFEFRPLTLGGKFMILGTYKTKDNCCNVAELLQEGNYVVRGKHRESDGELMPTTVVGWADVKDEISQTA
ncbi:hypothetical protein [Duganella vulcania]|uniref:Uncharacterized protein n=1 Tax=Duganella vulcania TaxID=2692166 RepID=A0A845GGT2_9BURK|nr:hypothetical protein [Duganella vulcania]MYM92632.1 hypothetical protein [Duganella vulcania]